MHDPHDESDSPGFLARLAGDPLRTRRIAAVGLLTVTPLAAFAHASNLGFATSMLAALCWVVAPFIAVGIGNGEAFFYQHGRGRRRVLLTLVSGVLLALVSCVVLAGLSESDTGTRRDVTEALGYGMLYLTLTLTVASLIAIILGYGKDYISDRIMRMRNDDW